LATGAAVAGVAVTGGRALAGERSLLLPARPPFFVSPLFPPYVGLALAALQAQTWRICREVDARVATACLKNQPSAHVTSPSLRNRQAGGDFHRLLPQHCASLRPLSWLSRLD
jgi:hypothetical protein